MWGVPKQNPEAQQRNPVMQTANNKCVFRQIVNTTDKQTALTETQQ